MYNSYDYPQAAANFIAVGLYSVIFGNQVCTLSEFNQFTTIYFNQITPPLSSYDGVKKLVPSIIYDSNTNK